MKTVLIALLVPVSIFFSRCHDGHDAAHAEKDSAHTAAHGHAGHGDDQGLQLNHGKKWKADASTAANVGEMKTIAANFDKQENKTLPDYSAASDSFTNAFTQLVSSCRMTGPDHDALHLWLEPLQTAIKILKNAGSTAEAAAAFETIKKQLADFDTYFE